MYRKWYFGAQVNRSNSGAPIASATVTGCSTGDLNCNGAVDSTDESLLIALYGSSSCSSANNWCSRADIDVNGIVDSTDTALLQRRYHNSIGFVESTDSNGQATLQLIDYSWSNGTQSYYSFGYNYTVNVSKAGWNSNATSFNLTGNTQSFFFSRRFHPTKCCNLKSLTASLFNKY